MGKIHHYLNFANQHPNEKVVRIFLVFSPKHLNNLYGLQIFFYLTIFPVHLCGCPPYSTLVGLTPEQQLPCTHVRCLQPLPYQATRHPAILRISNKSFLTLDNQYSSLHWLKYYVSIPSRLLRVIKYYVKYVT